MKNPRTNGKSEGRLLCPVCGKKFGDYLTATRHWGKYHMDIGPIAPYQRTWTLEGARFFRRGYNPGTNWHIERAEELREMRGHATTREIQSYLNQRAIENEYAADASRRLGMNPRKRKSPSKTKSVTKNLLPIAIIGGLAYLIYKNR